MPTPAVHREPIALPDFFAEGLAWDRSHERLLLAGIVDQSIVAVDLRGGVPRRFAAPVRGWSVFGVAIDPSRELVWAACAAVPQGRTLPGDVGRAGLFAFALGDGAAKLERLTPANDGVTHLFGDLAIGTGGNVYVTDTTGGGVFSSAVDHDDLRVVVPAGTFRSVQGIVVLDATTLVVADYSAGLVGVTLDDLGVARDVAVIERPAEVDLRGIDGLALRGRSIAAVQNGANPPQVLRIELSDDAKRIESAAVLLVPEPADGEPTLASFVDDEVWVTQTDRWDRVFDKDGRPRAAVPIAAPVVLRIPWL